MAIEALTNERWGFTSNCFVCEPKNPAGLRVPFFHDTDTGMVFADVTLDNAFSGAPAFLHGGVVLALLDECMAWAAIALAGKWAVTITTSTTFERPTRVGQPCRVEAQLTSTADSNPLTITGSVIDVKGRVTARANATFQPLSEAQAVNAIGSDIGASGAAYVTDPKPHSNAGTDTKPVPDAGPVTDP